MSSVEDRLEKLEQDVEKLKRAFPTTESLSAKKPGWISRISGSFKDDSEFDEILRLGREDRKADQVEDEFSTT